MGACVEEVTWYGCYKDGWKGIIVDEAFQHPAKFSRALIRRIYEHCFKRGWLRVGDTVVDPFGGVALGGLEAMRHGLRWIGVELEPRFVTLGNENIALWHATYGPYLPGWGDAVLLQGDSRRLAEVLRAGLAAGAVSSPPYEGARIGGVDSMRRSNDSVGDYGDTPGQLGAMAARGFDAAVSSPPYIDSINSRENGIDWEKIKPDYPGRQMHAERIAMAERHHNERRYGDTNGQLGAMAAGDFAAAVSSPPFEDSLSRDVVNPVDRVTFARAHGISNAEHVSPIDMERAYSRDQEYGCTVGQLGAMHGRFDAVVSSPPFQEQQTGGGLARTMVLDDGKPLGRNCGYQYQATVDGNLGAMTGEFDAAVTSPPYQTGGHHQHQMDAWNTNGRGQSGHSGGYADESDGQVQGDGNDFWLAARAVVTQTYQVLAPGAISVWVCKDFVRNKQRVPFSDQWRQLCAACGFELVEWVHASLVTDNGVQVGLFGEDVALRKERKSFFRRLAENKGSPRIDWEDVLFMRRV